jgi:hypothetical protein
MSNCPICEIELDAKDISILENHIVAKHSDVNGTAKVLATILRKIEDLDRKLRQHERHHP